MTKTKAKQPFALKKDKCHAFAFHDQWQKNSAFLSFYVDYTFQKQSSPTNHPWISPHVLFNSGQELQSDRTELLSFSYAQTHIFSTWQFLCQFLKQTIKEITWHLGKNVPSGETESPFTGTGA